MSKRDYYEILGVGRSASDAEIKSAYRKLALQFHPDRNPGDKKAEERFKEAAEAYAILADTEKRQAYDRFGHAAVGGAGTSGGFDPTIFSDFGDIFGGLGDIFGFGDAFGGGRRRGGPRRGGDLRYDLEIGFEESASGTETTIQIPREQGCDTCAGTGAAKGSSPATCRRCEGRGQVRFQQGFLIVARTCDRCGGSGQTIDKPCTSCRGAGRVATDQRLKVKVPAGIASGQRLRLVGEGEPGAGGGPAGDLYVVIHVREHPLFRREGDDLHCELAVAFPTLALGGQITVKGHDGSHSLQIASGTAAGSRLRLRGKGMPNVSGRGRGDLYVRVQVAVPTELTGTQRDLIEALAKEFATAETPTAREHEDEAADSRPFFDRVKDIFG